MHKGNYRIDEFIQMIIDHHFVEAHEVLEDDWKALKKIGDKSSAKFLQGLINGTTSLALFVKGRPDAAEKVWSTFVKYKVLFDEVELENRDKYIKAMELLEDKYSKKGSLC
ncbi:MAG TPA: DUF309 domain-containing protein [Arcobacter sp.]|nr:DUF309 domain-containing protein [Arcobacter sp.]HIP56430.1 DUF309 domain-containing protein [Arcobacter sp.]